MMLSRPEEKEVTRVYDFEEETEEEALLPAAAPAAPAPPGRLLSLLWERA
jgi:hypothetical protein